MKASSSSAASRSIVSSLGNWRPSIPAMTSSWSCTWVASGWAKMVRMAAATISAEPLGTLARMLRRKWTRQRWTAAPAMVAWTAWRSPRWASAMTSCTPASPRAFKLRRNWVQNAPSSLSPTAKPSTSRRPSAHTPVAITTAWATTRRLTRALQ